jgi:hypothetical protein
MNLGEYIDWYESLSYDEMFAKYREIADPNVPGYLPMGKVNLPEELINEMTTRKPDRQPEYLGVKSQYRVVDDNRLLRWAEKQFSNLKFVDCRMQSQMPGEKVPEHIDLLGFYLKTVTKQAPWLRKIQHSIDRPGIDVYQLIIACDDQIDGQVFGFDNPGNWNWTKGECIRVNTWRGMHWTENKSNKIRNVLKVRGISFGMKKQSYAIT